MATTSDDERTISLSEGRYLCGMLTLTLADDPPISNSELADFLEVSAASVTEMLDSFEKEGLVTHEPYYGAELTACGERVAREFRWRRCAVQRFFEATSRVQLQSEQAYRIGRLLSHEDVCKLSDRFDQPCSEYCEATEPDECNILVS
ncbi:metal-dependent transcriptional regulator [Natrinema limicola]|uniref:Iron dependent repressor n=1 Tax=Natrinema limicola JCM 13563 TaxID=1230457 RepID=M0CRL9_9EURY|nr:metal-dependent transcriptional regulator [Natrinema limicola]ELZ25920.1 iron dependent repressor [Natrinema limicola JCM 13563]